MTPSDRVMGHLSAVELGAKLLKVRYRINRTLDATELTRLHKELDAAWTEYARLLNDEHRENT